MKDFKKFYFWGFFLLVLFSFQSSYGLMGYVLLTVNANENSTSLPKILSLDQNYPNPFNMTTELRYFVPEKYQSVFVSLRIYNLLGQEIRTLVNENQASGRHSVTWDGRDDKSREVGSGIYFYRLEAGDSKLTKRMVLIK